MLIYTNMDEDLEVICLQQRMLKDCVIKRGDSS